jgi:hypothetical protein
MLSSGDECPVREMMDVNNVEIIEIEGAVVTTLLDEPPP